MITIDNFFKSVISESVVKGILHLQKLPEYDGNAMLNVEAIDIGYGVTKYTCGFDKSGEPNFASFPSLVPRAPANDISGYHFLARDTKRIESGGVTWEIGPDCYQVANKNDVRPMHDDFINTEEYRVLLKGALAYIGKKEIDYLVLGLPVSNMDKEQSAREFAEGVHVINDELTVTVKNVLVVPQPLGALYNYAINSDNFERLMQTNSLVLDAGYHTFDFLTTCGLQIKASRSGARPGGMYSILNAISNSIRTSEGVDFDDLNEIDIKLDLANYTPANSKRSLFIYGNEIPLEEHVRNTAPVIGENINFLRNKVQDTKDIAQIVIAGGPGVVFKNGITKAFPKNKLVILNDGIYSNCRGFLYWGLLTAFSDYIKNLK
jgi:plasmid segregation protein ParM